MTGVGNEGKAYDGVDGGLECASRRALLARPMLTGILKREGKGQQKGDARTREMQIKKEST